MALDPVHRAMALVRFLLDREPSSLEREKFDAFSFDFDMFMISLLCSDEAARRYGDITQHLIDYVREDLARDREPHRIAHDLAMAKEELDKLQITMDHLNGQMLELLRQEDRIASFFESIRTVQADFNAVRDRLEKLEATLRQSVREDDDC